MPQTTCRVILLRAEGRAFCAGYGLDGSTQAQPREAAAPEEDRPGEHPTPWRPGGERRSQRTWDSVSDMHMIGSFVDVCTKLWHARKPNIAAVKGCCIGRGTDMVLYADRVVASEGANFGDPTSRVWGTPTTAIWVYRMGLERAKRYLLSSDEISTPVAAEIGLGRRQVLSLALGSRSTRRT